VRAEIEAALTQRIRIVPIVVGRRMPTEAELPISMQEFALIQCFELPPGREEFNERPRQTSRRSAGIYPSPRSLSRHLPMDQPFRIEMVA
jgi:hypothetical protein